MDPQNSKCNHGVLLHKYSFIYRVVKRQTPKYQLIAFLFAAVPINQFMERNGKIALTTFGKNFFDVALGIVIDLLHAFFDKTPAKFIITTDLSPYVKNKN